MENQNPRTKKYILVVSVFLYLLAFGWFIQNTDNLSVKIFMGVMGLLLVIGMINFLREKNP
jgi:hypothetical protein